MAIDFSDLGATPIKPEEPIKQLDFSDLGAMPLIEPTEAAPVAGKLDFSDLGATPEKTGLEKAVGVSEAVLGGLGKVAGAVTAPFRKAEEVSGQLTEAATGKLTDLGVPEPLAKLTTLPLAAPAAIVKTAKVPFKAIELLDVGAEKVGTVAAEELSKRGLLNPVKSAVLGTGIAMIPQILLSMVGLKGIPKGKLAAPAGRIAADTAKEEARLASAQAKAIALTTERGTPISQDLLRVVKEGKDITGTQKSMSNLNFIADKVDDAAAGPFRSSVLEPLEQSVVNQAAEVAQLIDPATALLKKLKIKLTESNELLAFMERKAPAPTGKEAAYAKMRDFYRKNYDELLDEGNAVNAQLSKGMTPAQRTAAGLDKIPRRDDFVHHMRDMNVADDLGAPLADVNSSTGFIKRRVPGRGFDKPRFDAIPEEMLSGAIEAFESYVHKAKRFKHNAQHADKLRELSKQAREGNKLNLADALDSLADRATGEAAAKAAKALKVASGGAVPPSVLRKLLQKGGDFANNVILGNLGAAVAQTGAQMIGSIYLGAGRALSAIPGGLGISLWDKIIKASVNPSYRSFARANSKTVQLYERAVAKSTIHAVGPVKQSFVHMFNYINDSMVVGTFNQAYKAAIQSKYKPAQAVKIADQIAARTQAKYVDILRPAVISKSSPVGRLFLPFQTYVFNALDVLKSDVLFAKLSPIQKAAAVGQMAATGVLLNLGLKAVTGKTKVDFRDVIPGIRVAEMGLSGVFLAASLPVQAGSAALKGEFGKGAAKAAQATALFGFPVGGLQALKTFKGAKAIAQGKTDKPIRSLLFGPIKKEPKRRGRKRRKRRKR